MLTPLKDDRAFSGIFMCSTMQRKNAAEAAHGEQEKLFLPCSICQKIIVIQKRRRQ